MNEQQQVSPQDGQLALAMFQPNRLERRYHEWRRNNPHIYAAFAEAAREMAETERHFSADGIGHIVRYKTRLRSVGDPYKVNNSYIAFIARDLMAEGVVPAGFFETRERKAA